MTIRTTAFSLLGLSLLLVAGCSVEANNGSNDQAVETSSELAAESEEEGAIAASGGLNEIDSDSTEYEDIRVMQLANGLENPWAVAFLPDDRLLITERPGRLLLWDDGDIEEISGLPDISARGQGGLLDVVTHPDFEENGWVYFTYSKPNGSGDTATALGRGRLEDTALTDVEDLFVQDRYSGPGRHYGSRLAWRADGTLMMSIGDRGSEPPRAQDQGDHAGSVLRLNDDGSVPSDNPFVDDPDVLDEIYTYGNRNIQGLVVDPDTDTVWATNHGPRGGDEIQLLSAGNNYGWPLVTRGLDYGSEGPFPDAVTRRMDGVEEPFYEFLPTHAPSGLAFVTTEQFPAWQGNLLAGGLRSERIRRVVFDENEVLHEEELLLGTVGRIRDVRQGPDGLIYVLSDASDGGLYRIEPAN
jgi:glucose/arabinose dehydrogenase